MNAKQFFFAMVALIVLGFGGIVAAFYWGEAQLKSKADEIANLQTDRDIARDKIIALSRAKKSTDDGDEASRILDVLLPQTKKQETLVADILFTATQEANIPGDKISALTFESSSDPTNLSGTQQFREVPGVLSYPFNMTVTDINYETLLKLLQEIESNGRLVQVDNLQISPSKTVPGQLSSVSLSLKAFLKP